ncbi:hypothetical protein CEXT_193971 [Caerostris extrusa]|uniref:Uncharacterized protein n=1 Tax=Caerostris extrusa TaxID=172846 RepID=A0AAV4Q8C3_CAEEX|nr:hypothetical protein CEXT_193971 [Caerostris extrusa]
MINKSYDKFPKLHITLRNVVGHVMDIVEKMTFYDTCFRTKTTGDAYGYLHSYVTQLTRISSIFFIISLFLADDIRYGSSETGRFISCTYEHDFWGTKDLVNQNNVPYRFNKSNQVYKSNQKQQSK